ncbi:MAG: IS1595 family transposase [Blautia sp.]|nr:IS1595 family transposase [Blautia sp.]
MADTLNLKEVIIAYRKLSFSDQAAFYAMVPNDFCLTDGNLQSFLIETRISADHGCIYCGSSHVVKNGIRKDGTQRFLCRDCKKSFLPTSESVTSRTRKTLSVWASYLKCMLDKKTLREASEECGISMSTAFSWRHKILDALHEINGKVLLDGTVEADETFFDVSYKGNHKNFELPREPHKRGHSVRTKGLSSEKVCVPCAVNDAGFSYARPGKTGKVSSDCIKKIFDGVIAPGAVLCTDNEKAYAGFASSQGIRLVQTDTDCRVTHRQGKAYGIQRINAWHSRLKGFLHRFRGVSTKYLENYLVWNDVLENSQRSREEVMELLLSQILTVRISLRNRDIPCRPPLPAL